MLSIRAARRYRWRLAGGRLMVGDTQLRFAPNRVERTRPDTDWACGLGDVQEVHVRKKAATMIQEARART